jgi:CheY-like chemotaxis protein
MLMPPTTPARAVGVLLVDDDTELGELVREYLAREGFSLEVEGDGTRAVERALSGDYRLIVLDVMLPGVSGFDILRHLRAGSSASAARCSTPRCSTSCCPTWTGSRSAARCARARRCRCSC